MLIDIRDKLKGSSPRDLNYSFPHAAVLVPIVNNPREPELIFTLRSPHLGTHSGQVAFPGGKQDETDLSLMHTALRETEEEVGISPQDVQVAGRLSQVVSKHGIVVTPYVGVVPVDVQLVPNEAEIASIFNVPISFFLENQPHGYDCLSFEQCVYHVPRFNYEDYLIWGLSAVILSEFLNVVFEIDSLVKVEKK
ncbi:MAG: CoA pyrophosphatase [Pseudomonadales bacterium]|nr:CoA pyrophosphatase [Pseudomonadales bacterium]